MANEKRLIDANDMKTAFREWFDHDDYRTMNELIDDVPTVDAVEVVHGRWECEHETWGAVRCSNCNEKALIEKLNGELLTVFSNYCPNCGAKMDGGNEDG